MDFVKGILLLSTFSLLCGSMAFATPNDLNQNNFKNNNVENIKLLLKQEVKSQNYSYEIKEAGVFVEPQATSFSQEYDSNTQNSANSNLQQEMDYNLKSNIGYDFNKYLTGFITYNLGDVSYDPNSKNVNLNINSSTLGVSGIGSKINVSDDFGIKFMYFQQQINSSLQQNSNDEVSQELQLKSTIKF